MSNLRGNAELEDFKEEKFDSDHGARDSVDFQSTFCGCQEERIHACCGV